VSQPRRPQIEYLLPQEPEILQLE